MMTKDQELYAMEIFKKEYLEMPIGTVAQQEPPLPDFLLTTKSGERIGIELTEAIISEQNTKYLSFGYKITDLVLEKLKLVLPYTFDITVKCYENVKLTESDVKKAVDQLVNLCLDECRLLENFEIYRVGNFGQDVSTYPPSIQQRILNDGYRNLPNGVASIKIGRYDAAGESWNSKSGGIVVPHFTDDRLRSILQKKESKNYATCDKYWLVIWESGGINSYYHDIKIEMQIESKFDKIFLARTYRPEIVVLK